MIPITTWQLCFRPRRNFESSQNLESEVGGCLRISILEGFFTAVDIKFIMTDKFLYKPMLQHECVQYCTTIQLGLKKIQYRYI